MLITLVEYKEKVQILKNIGGKVLDGKGDLEPNKNYNEINTVKQQGHHYNILYCLSFIHFFIIYTLRQFNII